MLMGSSFRMLQLVLECFDDLSLKLQLGDDSKSLIVQPGYFISEVVNDDVQWNFE